MLLWDEQNPILPPGAPPPGRRHRLDHVASALLPWLRRIIINSGAQTVAFRIGRQPAEVPELRVRRSGTGWHTAWATQPPGTRRRELPVAGDRGITGYLTVTPMATLQQVSQDDLSALAGAIERLDLEHRLEHRLQDLRLIDEIGGLASRGVPLQQIVVQLALRLRALADTPAVLVFLASQDGESVLAALAAEDALTPQEQEALRAEAGALMLRFNISEPAFVPLGGEMLLPESIRLVASRLGIRSALTIGLRANDKPLGFVLLFEHDQLMVGGDLFDRYRRLGNLIAVTLSNASLYAKTLRAAEHDGLTGLLNRQTIDARYDSMLQLAEETGKPFAAALMDLDGLKAINDSFGHRAGDDAIRGFARVLAFSTPDDAFIGRFGGDEFLVLLPGTDMQAVQQWVKAVQAGVDAQNSQGDLPFPVEFSVGAGAWPETADPIAAADHQLYQHKRRRHSPAGSGPSELERAAGELLNGLRRLRGATWAGLLRLDSFQSPAWLAQSGETMAVIDPQLVSATLARGETVEQKLDEDWALLVVSCSHLGRLTGALAAVVPAVETPAALSTLTAFAEAAAVLVVSPNGRSGTAAQVARLSALYEIARSFAATLDYRQVLSLILEYASRLTGADYVLISTMVGHERPLMLVGAYDLPAGLAAKITERQLRIDEGVVGRAVREARAQVVSDLRFDPDAKPVVPGMRSEATMPIVTGSALIGVIDLLSAEPATFDAVDLAFLGTLAQLSGVAITQARLYAQARHEAGRTLEVVRSLQQLVEYRLQDVSRRIAEELGAGVGRTHPQIEDLIGQLDRLTRSHRHIAETSFDGLNLLEVAGRVVEIASEARWSNPMPVLQVTGAAVPLTDRQANVTSLVLHELLLALLPADGRKQASEIRIRITTTPATAVISVYCWLLPRLLESLPLLNEQVAGELLGTVCYKRGRVIIEFPLRPVEPILWTPTPVLRNRT